MEETQQELQGIAERTCSSSITDVCFNGFVSFPRVKSQDPKNNPNHCDHPHDDGCLLFPSTATHNYHCSFPHPPLSQDHYQPHPTPTTVMYTQPQPPLSPTSIRRLSSDHPLLLQMDKVCACVREAFFSFNYVCL